MTNFRVGDKVQIDPALVNGGVRERYGVGIVLSTSNGGTQTFAGWPSTEQLLWTPTRDLVPVAGTFREAER